MQISSKLLGREGFCRHGHTMIMFGVLFLCSDWWKFDRCVHTENLCSLLTLVYFDSYYMLLAECFVPSCDVFNCLFPLDVQNKIQLPSRVFCYSWLVCLLGFWLGNTSLVKVGNPISDGIVFVFHLAWKLWSDTGLTWYLSGAASRMVSLSNYCIWCLFFISNLMKSSVVYAAI